jgi:hypothetical protein
MNYLRYYLASVFILSTLSCAAKKAPLYDEKADASRDIASAVAVAETSKRNIVLVFGANW